MIAGVADTERLLRGGSGREAHLVIAGVVEEAPDVVLGSLRPVK